MSDSRPSHIDSVNGANIWANPRYPRFLAAKGMTFLDFAIDDRQTLSFERNLGDLTGRPGGHLWMS